MKMLVRHRESRPECPTLIAQSILAAVQPMCLQVGIGTATIVIKNRKYENWLIADPIAVNKMRKRFRLSASVVQSITNGAADSIDAESVLKRAAKKIPYAKKEDSARIMKVAEPLGIASNSRSFRRFLRVLGNPAYREQSLNPV
jgi:hypothetical protein